MQRHADATFVERAFAGTQRRVVRHGRGLRCDTDVAAVVAGEDDDGVLLQAALLQVRQHPADAFIKALHHRRVDRVLVCMSGRSFA